MWCGLNDDDLWKWWWSQWWSVKICEISEYLKEFNFQTVRVDVWNLWNCCHDVSRCCTKCWQLVLKKSRWQTQKRIDSTQSQLFLKVFMMKHQHNHKFYQLFEQNFRGAKILRDIYIFSCLNRIPVFSVLNVVGWYLIFILYLLYVSVAPSL